MLDLLTVTWNVNPDILSIGGFHLRWYSVLFVAGLFPVGYYIMRSFYKREGIPVESLDALLFACSSAHLWVRVWDIASFMTLSTTFRIHGRY